MKKLFYFCLVLFLFISFQTVKAQQSPSPVSKIIDAKQLLLDVETLSSDAMQGRKIGTPGGAKAREYVLERFKKSGLKSFSDSYLQPFEFDNRKKEKIQGMNVVGYIEGKQHKDKYIIVTAHYDHVGIIKDETYNGADDNASGTSALFAFVSYFSKNHPSNSIIFVAFDGEESGLQGSRAFVAKLPVKKESIILNVNMDMIAHNDKNELYATGTSYYAFLKPYLEDIAKSASVKLLLGHDTPNPPDNDWTFQSDQAAFHVQKIPFIYFGVEDHKDYHKPTDDFANINQAFYVHAVETILAAIKTFDANLSKIEAQRTVQKS